MKKALSLAILSLSLSPLVLSSTEEILQKEVDGKKIKAELVNDSVSNRIDKKFTFNISLTGIEFSANSAALELGYFIDSNNIINARYTELKGMTIYDYDDDISEDHWDRDRDGHVISLGLKTFVSNSFYIKPEIYNRVQEDVHYVSSSYSSEFGWTNYYTDRETINDVGLSFKIGNQWQWDKFTMGCDWFGFNRTITKIKKSSRRTRNEDNHIALLNFYLGASF